MDPQTVANILAGTHTLTEARGEASDEDRPARRPGARLNSDKSATDFLSETQTLTDARGEARDEDRSTIPLAETQTMTKVSGESRDDDRSETSIMTSQWQKGDRRPLLFRNAASAAGEAPVLRYDRALSMSVSFDGKPLIAIEPCCETMTHTAARSEDDDDDR